MPRAGIGTNTILDRLPVRIPRGKTSHSRDGSLSPDSLAVIVTSLMWVEAALKSSG
jgi:hypothetical protein